MSYYSAKPPAERAIEKADNAGTRAVISCCRDVIEFCLDFIEGALPGDEQQKFRQHLAHCPACVVFFETYQKTPEVSREALATQIPAAVRDAVRSFLRTRSSS
jgi:anti-sigma factor RsiW